MLVVSRQAGGRHAAVTFAEAAVPGGETLTYSDVLDDDTCERIDREAYALARGWYRQGDTDFTMVNGVSLGRAFELTATVRLIRFLRAKAILSILDPTGVVGLDGVGEEWEQAASALGLPCVRIPDGSSAPPSHVPDPAVAPPTPVRRLAGRLLGGRDGDRDVAVLGSPRWAESYLRALSRHRIEVINPGRRVLIGSGLHRRRPGVLWLADELDQSASRGAIVMCPPALERSFADAADRLGALADAPRARRRRLLIATEDLSPAARTTALATRAAGGHVITLEHGISGLYREQVWSVADLLGAWGEPQARYHREAGDPSKRVVPIGWPNLAGRARAGEQEARIDLLYFGQPTPSMSAGNWPQDMLAAASLVGGYAAMHLDRTVAWKQHPATSAYGGASDPGPLVKHIAGPSLALIRRARVVAVAFSTTALEAMALGRPVVHLAGRGHTGGIDFIRESGASVEVSSLEELDSAVEELLQDGTRRRRAIEAGRSYVGDFISGFDEPGSAERALDGLVTEYLAHGG